MAIEKQVNIKITESGLDELNNELKQLDTNLDNVSDEAQKASKSVDDVTSNGGAIAILDELTGGWATKLKDAYEASKLLNFSLKGMRTALIATGIGAFVVALGVIVAYWDDIVELIDGANEKLQKQIDLSNESLENLSHELKLLEEQEEILKLQGESTEEIKQAKEAIILIQQEENALLLENLKTQLEREKAQVKELTFWERLKVAAADAFSPVQGSLERIKGTLASEEEQDRLNAITQQIQDAELRALSLQRSLLEIGQERRQENRDARGDEDPFISSELERLNNLENKKLELLAEFTQKRTDQELEAFRNRTIELDTLDLQRTLKEQQNAEARAKFAEIEAEQKAQAIAFANNALSETADLLGESTAAGKAAALASALISTYQGINNVWAEKSESGFVGAGLAQRLVTTAIVAAQGFANVKKILAVKTPSGGGSGANAGAAVGQQPTAPSFNVVGTSDTNQLAQTLNQQQEPIQAFVVASDVTGAQAVNNNIVETATIS